MRRILFITSVLLMVITACKKEEVEDESNSPAIIGLWEIVKTETTHELGHYGPYDPPTREIDTRQTVIIDHQKVFSTIDVSSGSLTWTEVGSESKVYHWEYENEIFSLTDNDTTLAYHVTELTPESFVFFIKDFKTYNDSTDLIAYEEYEYVYHLNKSGD